jgi:hypothetical protein
VDAEPRFFGCLLGFRGFPLIGHRGALDLFETGIPRKLETVHNTHRLRKHFEFDSFFNGQAGGSRTRTGSQ